MKVKLFSSSGIFQNNVILDGFKLMDFLTLYRNPEGPNEAATKRYADAYPSVFDISVISGKPVRKENLVGGFTGDLVGFNASDVYLSNTGVQPGTYNRVTVNDKGRITKVESVVGGGPVTLPFNNITNKPLLAGGYIADTQSYVLKPNGFSSNVTVGGNVVAMTAPSLPNHAGTKEYLNSKINAMTNKPLVGSLRISTPAIVDPKYLRANGALLNKLTYAALYAVLGDTYNDLGDIGFMGQPWRQQYAFNKQTSPTNLAFSDTGTTIPIELVLSQAIVTKNRVYLLGGLTSGGVTNAVYTAPINSDGTLGVWSVATSLPIAVLYPQVVVTKRRVYMIGGGNTVISYNTIYTAPINADGTIGAWTSAGTIPTGLGSSQAAITHNRIYLFGGALNNDAYTSEVLTAPINADGTIGTWTTGPSLPVNQGGHRAILTKNRIYLAGGYSDNKIANANVFTASVNPDGTLGTWTTSTSLPGALSHSEAVVVRNRVYLLGGLSANHYVNTVYTAPINVDGTLGTWVAATSLPAPICHSQAVVTSSRVYLLGGGNDAAYLNKVYSAGFNGGSDDYLAVIAANIADATQFKLPDYSEQNNGILEYFIRATV